MRTYGRIEPLATAALIAISVWLSATASGWAQQPKSVSDTEVVVYGREQALVDAITKRAEPQAHQEYPNELDHVLSVLLTRAYPKPDPHNLIRHTIDALCGEVETLAHTKIPDSQRDSWVASAEKSVSFERALADLAAASRQAIKPQQLVSAGLKAMLSGTGSTTAAMLSAAEAESMTHALEARTTPSQQRGTFGLDVSNWPTLKVVPGMPAAKAGLRDGDVALRINSTDVAKTETAADGLKALRAASNASMNRTTRSAGTRSSPASTAARKRRPGSIVSKNSYRCSSGMIAPG